MYIIGSLILICAGTVIFTSPVPKDKPENKKEV
jgi:hypothetical protein